MAKISNTAATVKALNGSPLAKLTPARKTGLEALRTAAISEGNAAGNFAEAQETVAKRFHAVCTATPDSILYEAARRYYMVGRMVAYLIRKGRNEDVMVLTAECAATYDAKTRAKGSEGRLAYDSAKVLLSGLCKRAKVQSPTANSSDVEKRAPNVKPKSEKKAPVAKVPTITNDNDLRAYVAGQRVAMLAVVARASQCKALKNETTSIIQEAMALLAKLAPQG